MRKSKLFTRILSIFLCSAMITGIFSGCRSGGNTESSTSSQPSSQSSDSVGVEKGPLYIEGSEGVTLTYWIPMDSTQAQNFSTLAEHPYFIWLKEQTGVNVEFIHPSYEQADQQLNLMIASKKFYDLLYNAWYPGGPQTGLDENCFIDLNPYLNEYMPDYKAALECDDGSFGQWEWGEERDLYKPKVQPSFYSSCLSSDGSLWCVTQLWTDAYPTDCGPVIRKDWLDEAGLDVPVTLDELETVLEAFKSRGGDVVPMNLGASGTNKSDGSIISAFDLYSEAFTLNADKTIVQPHAYTQDAFKDYLTLMHDWYSKGYIDADFMNRDSDSLAAMFLDDRLGIYMNQYNTPEYWEQNYAGNQNFEVVAMPLPRKDKDQQLNWLASYDSCPTNYTCITTSCEHPEIAAAWLNVGYTKEGILRHTYGIEGETYELRDGVPYYLDSVISGDQDYIFSCELFPYWTSYSSGRSGLMSVSDAEITPSPYAEAGLVWGQNASSNYNWTYTVFEDDDYGIFETKLNDALTYADPMVLKFIIGEESLDQFDQFRDTAKSLGLDEAQAKAQDARDKMSQGK